MKMILVLLISVVTFTASGDEVNKWIDEKGKVHYGNVPPETDSAPVKKLEIQNNFDQNEYEKAKKRHIETEQFAKELEKEREEEAKRKVEEEAERKANIKHPPPFADPRSINLPRPYYEAPRVPGKPWIGSPIPVEPTPLPSGK